MNFLISEINLKQYRYLIFRRVLQITVLFLFTATNYFGWTILKGNYSAALILEEINLADPYATLQILLSGFMTTSKLLFGALIIFGVYAFLGGRVFCSWICPYNLVSDFVRFVRNKLNWTVEYKINLSRNTRYYILALSLILSVVLGFAAFEIINPVSLFYRSIIFGLGSSWIILLGLVFFDLIILKNGWCGYLCPIGAFYSLIGKIGILKVFHIAAKCTNCSKCFEVCPEEQVLDIVGKSDGNIKLDACTKCGRCIEVCDDKALKFKNNYKK